MIIYNLTDIPAPGSGGRQPQDVKISGVNIPPGGSKEFPDNLQISKIVSLLDRGFVGVDGLPMWYQRKKEELRHQPVEVEKGAEAVEDIQEFDMLELETLGSNGVEADIDG